MTASNDVGGNGATGTAHSNTFFLRIQTACGHYSLCSEFPASLSKAPLTAAPPGHVWQARYFSCPLDRMHLWRAIAYVERNPVRARPARRSEHFPWSSAAARLGLKPVPGFLDLSDWQEAFTPAQWHALLASEIEETEFGERLTEAGTRGRPLGDDDFLASLERRAGRRLRAKPVGRPRQLQREDRYQMELDPGV